MSGTNFSGKWNVAPNVRFWARVKKTKTCWLWTGSINSPRYCQLLVRGKRQMVHRYSYRIHKGEIPEGMLVCHTCDNPRCVRPDHLFLGTHQDNAKDRNRKGRNADVNGEKNAMAKLTEENVREMRQRYIPRKAAGILAKKFGVGRETIRRVAKRILWKHVS